MPEADQTGLARWEDARTAIDLLSVDRVGLGGASVRAQAGPVRAGWLRALAASLPHMVRMPANIGDEALLGGIDLPATLQAGRPIHNGGLLRAAQGGVLLAAMAERIPPGTAARLGIALDSGADLALVTLDEGAAADEACPPGLLDRLAFQIELDTLSHREMAGEGADPGALTAARSRLEAVHTPADMLEALCATSLALGIGSARAPLLAVRAARAAAALAGRDRVEMEDAILATRLVLAPRATRLPEAEPEESDAQPQDAPPPDPPPDSPPDTPQPDQQNAQAEENRQKNEGEVAELLLQAARAAIPAGLLARLTARDFRTGAASHGRQGAPQKGNQRGRPVGVRAASPTQAMRLNLIETLRAAAPWQRLRATNPPTGRIALRRDDFRVTRTQQRGRTTTIFVVDASGSSALNRLAEAKGAVELLLADCYRRRDQVAVVAFRGTGAQVLLPPTRSLVRAKRSLAGLPGGGGTPLAAGLDAGFLLAETARRAGATPTLVLLTDGRANVTRAGSGGRQVAAEEAGQAARRLRTAGIAALVLDTSPRPAAEAAHLAQCMGALYVPLPYANAASVSGAVRAARGA